MALERPARSVPQTPWWQGAVIYENHLPTFRDGDGDGVGDLQGLVDSLDYLAEVLRVDAIWVGPFYRSPLLDQGFDISDYYDVEPVFGSLATVDKLLAEAHARGLKVIADYVPNHTSDQHPWFVESRSSRDDPRRGWYVWADPRPDGSAPNNWVSESGGPAWELDAATGQYYLHSHLKEQPDLNWRNPQVRSAMLDVLRFWLDRGVDGVRIDVAHMLMKDPLLRDNPPNPSGEPNPWDIQHPDFTSQLHVNDRLHPDLHDVLREIRGVLDSYDDRVAIAEIEALSWEPWAEFFGAELDGIHLPFAFRLIETPWQADTLAAELRELQSALPPAAWPCLALGNHDRPRLATRLGRRAGPGGRDASADAARCRVAVLRRRAGPAGPAGAGGAAARLLRAVLRRRVPGPVPDPDGVGRQPERRLLHRAGGSAVAPGLHRGGNGQRPGAARRPGVLPQPLSPVACPAQRQPGAPAG